MIDPRNPTSRRVVRVVDAAATAAPTTPRQPAPPLRPRQRSAAVSPMPPAEEAAVVSAAHGVAIECHGGRWAICGEHRCGSWQHRDALAMWLAIWIPIRRERLRAHQLRVFRRRVATASAALHAAETVVRVLELSAAAASDPDDDDEQRP